MSLEAQRQVATVSAIQQKRPYITLTGSWLGWLFDALDSGIFGFMMLAMAASFKVSLGAIASTAAWFMFATGIGGYLFGNLSDRIGRKKVLVLSVFTYATGTLLCGLAPNLIVLDTFRFVTGLAVGGLWSAAAALISEAWKPEGRAKALAILQTGWSGGSLLAAIFAWVILNPHNPESWRNLFVIASIPAFATFIFILFFVQESQVWLDNREFIKKNAKKASIGTIFHRRYLKKTTLAFTVSALAMLGFWTVFTFIPTYLQKILGFRIDQAPVFLVWSGVGAVIGYLLFGVLAEKIGRKVSFVIFFLGMTVMIPVFTYITSHMHVHGAAALVGSNLIILGVSSAFLGFFSGYFSGFGAWYSELFPTSIRSTAAGFCFNFGRLGAVVGIELVPALLAKGMSFPVVISLAAISYVFAAIISLTIPETKGVELTSGN